MALNIFGHYVYRCAYCADISWNSFVFNDLRGILKGFSYVLLAFCLFLKVLFSLSPFCESGF